MRMDGELRLSSMLCRWYDVNKRDLPWRKTNDPYHIWLSEVILQQTRVDQGYSYYINFVNRFPSIDLLAHAEEDEVLKLWQGLGYYSRARNLHAAAKYIMNELGGIYPVLYKDVLALKGVGEYTAAAVVSFAYNQPYAVVDGNVYRVLSRVFGVSDAIDSSKGKKVFKEIAESVLDRANPGLHNQAIMEFGALQCIPTSPDCDNCPLSIVCVAYSEKLVSQLPVKEGKQKVKSRYFYYFDCHYEGDRFFRKREGKDIWHGLYEFPLIETTEEMPIEMLCQEDSFKKLFANSVELIKYEIKLKHVLSHQVIYATFYKVELSENMLPPSYLKIDTAEIDSYPVSRLVHKYLDSMESQG